MRISLILKFIMLSSILSVVSCQGKKRAPVKLQCKGNEVPSGKGCKERKVGSGVTLTDATCQKDYGPKFKFDAASNSCKINESLLEETDADRLAKEKAEKERVEEEKRLKFLGDNEHTFQAQLNFVNPEEGKTSKIAVFVKAESASKSPISIENLSFTYEGHSLESPENYSISNTNEASLLTYKVIIRYVYNKKDCYTIDAKDEDKALNKDLKDSEKPPEGAILLTAANMGTKAYFPVVCKQKQD